MLTTHFAALQSLSVKIVKSSLSLCYQGQPLNYVIGYEKRPLRCYTCNEPTTRGHKNSPTGRKDVLSYLTSYENIQTPLPFVLPQITLASFMCSPALMLKRTTEAKYFTSHVLAWALTSGQTSVAIVRYIEACAPQITPKINDLIYCSKLKLWVPILFFAVRRRDIKIIRLLVKNGADLALQASQDDGGYDRDTPSESTRGLQVSLLAYTALLSAIDRQDTTEIFRTLLAIGASPRQIPKSLWKKNYVQPPQQETPVTNDLQRRAEQEIEAVVRSSLNLTQRYYLHEASTMVPITPRELQVANHFKSPGLLELPYHLIGQRYAVGRVMDTVLEFIACPEGKPLCIFITGAPGHGKSEIARALHRLVGGGFLQVNCARCKRETDMFGPNAPLIGHEAGTAVNNFIVQNKDKLNVLFMDEFEKSSDEVRHSLLLPLEEGVYEDRRSNKSVNCTRTIFLMAVNLCQRDIAAFHKQNIHLGKRFLKEAPFEELQDTLRTGFITSLGAPFVSRIRDLIAVFPFTKEEQAVVAHSSYLSHVAYRRSQVNIAGHKIIGDLYINIVDDGKVFSYIRDKFYRNDLGVRTLQTAIATEITSPIWKLFVKSQRDMGREERANEELQTFRVSLEKDPTTKEVSIKVEKRGPTALESRKSKSEEQVMTETEWLRLVKENPTIFEVECATCGSVDHDEDSCPDGRRRKKQRTHDISSDSESD
jgi:hypothetical protein